MLEAPWPLHPGGPGRLGQIRSGKLRDCLTMRTSRHPCTHACSIVETQKRTRKVVQLMSTRILLATTAIENGIWKGRASIQSQDYVYMDIDLSACIIILVIAGYNSSNNIHYII